MNLTNDTIITNYTTEVALGHVKNTSIVNKFGYNTDKDNTSISLRFSGITTLS